MLEALQPLHPKLVHFPIALLCVAFVSELFSIFLKNEKFHQTSIHLYLFCALIIPFTLGSGLWEQMRFNLDHPLIREHKLFALCLTGILMISLPILKIIHKKNATLYRKVFLFFLVLSTAIVLLTAHFGGNIVYGYGIGVQN